MQSLQNFEGLFSDFCGPKMTDFAGAFFKVFGNICAFLIVLQ